MNEIIEALKSHQLQDIFFGFDGFSIAQVSTLNELQLGYSIGPDGEDLTGENEGDWQSNWVVIGNSTDVGDPFFVDTRQIELPVYTSMHGMGEWIPESVATSLSSFLQALSYLNDISGQDMARIYPDNSTIVEPSELVVIKDTLSRLSGVEDYWECFIEQHREWVDEPYS